MKTPKFDCRKFIDRILALDWFKDIQLAKLAEDIFEEDNYNAAHYLFKLDEDVEELKEIIITAGYRDITEKCADIANHALIIASKHRPIGD